MKNKVIWKRMILMLAAILLIFGGINAFWYVFKYMPYHKMSEKLEWNEDEELSRYAVEDEKYSYRMKMPPYLSYESGFLYVTPAEADAESGFVIDENGDAIEKNVPHVDMFIWPQMFSDTEFCVTIYEETESYMIPITKTGEYLPNEAYTSAAEQEQYKQLVQKFQSDIQDVLQAAQTMWGEYL